jgi:hypothetical protein
MQKPVRDPGKSDKEHFTPNVAENPIILLADMKEPVKHFSLVVIHRRDRL